MRQQIGSESGQQAFLDSLSQMIYERRKMTSPLYQVILDGRADRQLLQNFVIHRYPIKNFWTRNILGIAARIEDYTLRRELVENIYEEETGRITKSERHLETFVEFGECLGLERGAIVSAPIAAETRAVIEHNVGACNTERHFTEGVASVLLLMEGQPPIVNSTKRDMLTVMREAYRLPEKGCRYFVHHASSGHDAGGVSELEEDHAATAKKLLARHCDSEARRDTARERLARALDLRHAHFKMIFDRFYSASAQPFRYAA